MHKIYFKDFLFKTEGELPLRFYRLHPKESIVTFTRTVYVRDTVDLFGVF